MPRAVHTLALPNVAIDLKEFEANPNFHTDIRMNRAVEVYVFRKTFSFGMSTNLS